MTSEEKSFEATGVEVEEAINTGLQHLGLERDDVVVEILDEGAKGLLGLGRRDARVRLTVKTTRIAPTFEEVADMVEIPGTDEGEQTILSPETSPPEVKANLMPAGSSTVENGDESAYAEAEKETAIQILEELLQKVQVEATVTGELSEPDDLSGRRVAELEIEGKDLNVLIGNRGETLHSLQFISRLMAAHELKRRVGFVVDVSGYRHRRKISLQKMANRMAEKTINRNRSVTLEPMPPNERRVIHIALRNNEAVYTESVGEGRNRRIRINLK